MQDEPPYVKARRLQTAGMMVYLRRCCISEIPVLEKELDDPGLDRRWTEDKLGHAKHGVSHFLRQVEEISEKYGFEFDLENDAVRYKDQKLNERLGIEWYRYGERIEIS